MSEKKNKKKTFQALENAEQKLTEILEEVHEMAWWKHL